METRAKAKWIRKSPRKVRQVADTVRGRGVDEALNLLHFSAKGAALPLEKVIRSAVANILNMESKSKVEPENLYVKEIQVNEGFTLKRFRAASMGRASRIRKRTCHILVTVAEVESKKGKKE